MNETLKIVHCANFSNFKNGASYYAMDRKITHGLIENGHFVYDFSYRDVAKARRFLAFKKKSIQLMNQDLIDTCTNIKPDILLLGKAETISLMTLKTIKELIPDIKIVQWYVDFLETEKKEFFERFNYIDTFLKTSALSLMELSREYPNTIFSCLPNISDPAFDKEYGVEKEYEILYIARDHKEDVRAKFAKLLDEFCRQENINLKVYGSLGNKGVFGSKYYEEISKAKIAINFNRNDDLYHQKKDKILGSSDRMNQFLGAKVCTFSPRIPGFEKLYVDKKDIIYFDDINDCFQKIKYYLEDDKYTIIASNGQQKAYSIVNAKRITKFLLDLSLEQKSEDNYEWQEYIYKNGVQHGI